MNILSLDHVSLSFGGLEALSDVSFEIVKGSITSLIGPNGSGKTSSLNVISNFYKPDRGYVFFEGEKISHLPPYRIAEKGIARTFQNLAMFEGLTVIENIKVGRHMEMKTGIFSGMFYLGKARKEEIKHRKYIEEEIIDLLEIEDIRDDLVQSLPYGLQKKVELARALAMPCSLLLLDEPTAGMNADETKDIVRHMLDIRKYLGITILLIIHEIGVATAISDKVIVMNFGVKIADGTPDEIIQNPEVIKAYLGEKR